MPRLTVIKGNDEGKHLELTAELLSIGRDASNRVRLNDTEVSRKHAELIRTPEGYRLKDIGSANGTYVNNRAIHDVLLQSGDQIQVGQSLLLYSIGRAEPGPISDLAQRINLITRQDMELSSAIVQTIGETEGSRILTQPEKADVPFLRANLGILYEAIQAVSHILDLDQLLDRILELIFRALDADRGCILLRETQSPDPDRASEAGPSRQNELRSEEFEPRAVRLREGASRQDQIAVSRTMLDHVLEHRQGLLVNDASRDERFHAAQSIVRSGIREIICVPMRGRYETLGILYLDSLTPKRELFSWEGPVSEAPAEPAAPEGGRLPLPSYGSAGPAGSRPGKFNSDHLALAIALAHQAALAVEETRYYQALVQAERLAAVGQTVAALSHHIKNILQGLRSGGEILAMGLKDKDFNLLQQGWRIVEKNQGKIYYLVRDMLSYSKEREPTFENTNLNDVASDVVELMTARAKELNVALETHLDEKLPICSADQEGIGHALLNILGNALDAVESAESPRVILRTAVEPGGGWVQLLVQDNGTGISTEKVEEIFRPFVSTKGARGTGLGLAVSRKILREHGGDIVVQSEPGQGSTFVLRLPLRPAPSFDISSTMIGQAPPPPN